MMHKELAILLKLRVRRFPNSKKFSEGHEVTRLEDAMNVVLILTGLILIRLLIPVILIVFIGTMIDRRQVRAY
jgi:hypothetical protein